MKSRLVRNGFRAAPLAAALLFALGARAASAAEFWLQAQSFVKTMPDGVAVTMWGYAPCGAGFTACGPATAPGPALVVPAGEALTVHLFNNGLPEGVSVTIPGQPAPTGSAVVRNLDGRIRAFTHEAAPGGSADYVWPAAAIKAGTYLYQSGSHPAVQVQMGLYGAFESDASALNAYGAPDLAYDADLTLIFSEIDPALHAAVAAGQYGAPPPPPVPAGWMTSTMLYEARYFLVNGESYAPGQSPIALGSTGQRVLFRLLNAGLKSRLPAFTGLTLEVIAEDGNRYAAGQEPESAQVELPAGKTLDAFVIVPGPGYSAVYDRALGLTAALAPGGGMLAPLGVPDLTQNTLTVALTGSGGGTVRSASLPGGIDCGVDCTESYNPGTEVTLAAFPAPGSYFLGWSGGGCSGRGDCVTTLGAAQAVTADFRTTNIVRLFVPNGGESFPEGSLATIRWGLPAAARHVTLHYSLNGGTTWRLIDRGVPGNSLVWRVPLVASTRSNCLVRVRAYNASNGLVGTDVSAAPFTITNVVAARRR